MTNKKRYYPNKLKQLRAVPAEMFEPIEYDDLMDWKIAGYEIPSSVACIIREHNLKTGSINEYVYQQPSAAKNKCLEIMDVGESEFIVCDHDQIHHMTPRFIEDYEDPLA